jgi:hypothetical protein
VIDFDQPPETRYNQMFEDLKVPLYEMENYWYAQIPAESRAIIEDNMDQYMLAQPENYATMQSLASILGLPTS